MSVKIGEQTHIQNSQYDRSKGVLTKADYVYMRDLLETVLEQLQNSELDNDIEIDQLKQFFIKLDHHVERMR
ncbi:hypothetical protein SAMN05421643_11569 [Acinetobacter kyonggiensis]|uniref:Uncharacterized protein n=1 Tax=Acinetobacter kyonggiensis TaxID=595670 RepID=A0A1H3L4D1_9GAMM|nr:hypothetical protein SAMN05421643_11569 [Acinetobacter kyonggiensis]